MFSNNFELNKDIESTTSKNSILKHDFQELAPPKDRDNLKLQRQFIHGTKLRTKADGLYALGNASPQAFLDSVYSDPTPKPSDRRKTRDDTYLEHLVSQNDGLFDSDILEVYARSFPNQPIGYYQQEVYEDSGRLGNIYRGLPYIPNSPEVEQALPQYAGRILYQPTHKDFPKILADIVYGTAPSASTEEGRRKNLSVYTKQESSGQESWWAFPRNKRVGSEFTRINTDNINDLLSPMRNWDAFAEFIKQHEVPGGDQIPGKKGNRYYVYYASEGKERIPIVGWGHSLHERRGGLEDSRKIFKEVNPNLDAEAVLAGKQGLTLNELEQVLYFDVQIAIHKAQMLVPNFHRMPLEVQIFLADASLWTMAQHSDDTMALINAGKFNEAADEWIDNQTYRDNFNRPRFHAGQQLLRDAQEEMDFLMRMDRGEHGD